MPTVTVWPAGAEPEWRLTVARAAVGADKDAPLDGEFETDRELAEACVEGRVGAFDTLVERHRRSVYQLCYRFVGNHEDASDLSQEVFLRAHRGLTRFKGESAIATWLYRIGVNVCLNHVNAKKPLSMADPLEPERHVANDCDDPVEAVARGERAARVRAGIARLPAKQRAALILRTYHELPHKEIAAILGSSIGAVKANVFHALANLKKLLLEQDRDRF